MQSPILKLSKSIPSLLLLTSCSAGLLLAGCDVRDATASSGFEGGSALQQAVTEEAPISVPPALQVPADQKLKLEVTGVGVQIYQCTATTTGGVTSYGWAFVAPEADLYNDKGRFVGNHFLGPTWQYKDGSKVKGTVLAKVSAPDPTAIPWLLLTATPAGGDGKFSDVTYIQRLETSGGVAPATGCDAGHVGVQTRVDYAAEYLFYHPRATHTCD